jgi:beta-galactosidase
VLDTLRECGLVSSDQQLPATIRVKHGVNAKHHRIHYYLNYSSAPATFSYEYAGGTDLLTGNPLAKGKRVNVGAWDVVIAEETAP